MRPDAWKRLRKGALIHRRGSASVHDGSCRARRTLQLFGRGLAADGATATPPPPAAPRRWTGGCLVVTSHSRTVSSLLVVASSRPSWLKATRNTVPVCPVTEVLSVAGG